MATKFYLYTPDGKNNPDAQVKPNHIVSADEDLMALYPDVVYKYAAGSRVAASAPTAYDSAADAIIADATAIQSGIQPRGITVQLAGFGTAFLPILNNKGTISTTHLNGCDFDATLDAFDMADTAPLPYLEAVDEGVLKVNILAFRGETRNSN